MQSNERKEESFRWHEMPEWKKVESTWGVVSLHTLTECSGVDAIGSRATVIRWWSSDWVTGDGAECSVWRLNRTAQWNMGDVQLSVGLSWPRVWVHSWIWERICISKTAQVVLHHEHIFHSVSSMDAFFRLRRPWLMGWKVFIAVNSISATVNKEWHFSFINTWIAKTVSGKREAERKGSRWNAARSMLYWMVLIL